MHTFIQTHVHTHTLVEKLPLAKYSVSVCLSRVVSNSHAEYVSARSFRHWQGSVFRYGYRFDPQGPHPSGAWRHTGDKVSVLVGPIDTFGLRSKPELKPGLHLVG